MKHAQSPFFSAWFSVPLGSPQSDQDEISRSPAPASASLASQLRACLRSDVAASKRLDRDRRPSTAAIATAEDSTRCIGDDSSKNVLHHPTHVRPASPSSPITCITPLAAGACGTVGSKRNARVEDAPAAIPDWSSASSSELRLLAPSCLVRHPLQLPPFRDPRSPIAAAQGQDARTCGRTGHAEAAAANSEADRFAPSRACILQAPHRARWRAEPPVLAGYRDHRRKHRSA